MRRWLLLLLKIAISGALLWLAFRSVDLGAVAGHLARIDAAWIVAAIALLALQIVLAGMRWSHIVERLGAALPVRRAIRFSAIAAFFNQTTPSTVGGDAMRVWLLGRLARQWKIAIYSVLVDRIVGVVSLAVIVAVCLPWSLRLITAHEGRAAVLVIGLGGVAALPVALAIGGWRPGGRLAALRLARYAFDIAAGLRAALLDRARGWRIASLSLLIHLLTVGSAWSLARAIALSPDVLNFLILIPPVMLISMIPISVGGWGIREGAMVVAFGYSGMEQSQALALSVLMGGAGLIIGAIGGGIWIAEGSPALPAPDSIAPKTHA